MYFRALGEVLSLGVEASATLAPRGTGASGPCFQLLLFSWRSWRYVGNPFEAENPRERKSDPISLAARPERNSLPERKRWRGRHLVNDQLSAEPSVAEVRGHTRRALSDCPFGRCRVKNAGAPMAPTVPFKGTVEPFVVTNDKRLVTSWVET